jgi:hypothetical protein
MKAYKKERLVMRSNDQVELTYDQEVFVVIGGEEADNKLLTEDENLVVFESLWHAGPLVQDLHELGIDAQMVSMPLFGLYSMAQGMELGLWVLRHDGTITSIDEIVIQ